MQPRKRGNVEVRKFHCARKMRFQYFLCSCANEAVHRRSQQKSRHDQQQHHNGSGDDPFAHQALADPLRSLPPVIIALTLTRTHLGLLYRKYLTAAKLCTECQMLESCACRRDEISTSETFNNQKKPSPRVPA